MTAPRPTPRLGRDGPALPPMGLGCMGMSHPGRDEAESIRTIRTAIDLGITFLDTADKYGKGHNERLLARALSGRRDEVVLATKVGFVGSSRGPDPVDASPAHVHAAARASLQRLETDHVDLLYLHRIDPRVPVEESVGAMAELVEAGLVRRLGLSEVSVETLRRASAVHPIAAVQSEFSLWSRDLEGSVLAACRDDGIAFVAYSPLGIGFLTASYAGPDDLPAGNRLARGPRMQDANLPANRQLVQRLDDVAAARGCTPAQLALAWAIAKGAVPIPGSSREGHLRENATAMTIDLSDDEVTSLDAAFPPGAAAGTRKSVQGLTLVDR